MVFVLLSPSKTLAFDRPHPHLKGGMPHFQQQSAQLGAALKKLSRAKLGTLMAISDKLAELNAARYKNFSSSPHHPISSARNPVEKRGLPDPDFRRDCEEDTVCDLAILAYQGDTYQGLDAKTLTDAQLKNAQKHLGILTGLYGVVSPLDLIQPYRLEMSTPLAVAGAKNLYDFWGDAITDRINALVKQHKAKAVIGCASHEYLSAVQTENLSVPFIRCDFKEKKNGKLVTIGLFAKKARGMMARYVIENAVIDAPALKKFNGGGYIFDKTLSTDDAFVFVR